VDFDKLEPRTDDVIEKSQVLQVLKEEESEPEKKKLSTFLQPPNRPKIKPKEKPKQPKVPPKQPETQPEDGPNQEVCQNEEQQTTELDQPNTEQEVCQNEEQQTTELDQPNTEQEAEEAPLTEEEQLEGNELPQEQKEENEITTDTMEQPQIDGLDKVNDNKLLDIQSQLTALLQLPAVMQQQLSFIQEQITNIMQQKMAEVNPVPPEEDTDAGKEGMKHTRGIIK
jgi:hypothetical protein